MLTLVLILLMEQKLYFFLYIFISVTRLFLICNLTRSRDNNLNTTLTNVYPCIMHALHYAVLRK